MEQQQENFMHAVYGTVTAVVTDRLRRELLTDSSALGESQIDAS